jgi:hypothetical protein
MDARFSDEPALTWPDFTVQRSSIWTKIAAISRLGAVGNPPEDPVNGKFDKIHPFSDAFRSQN